MSHFGATNASVLSFLVTSSLGFKARVGYLIRIAKANVYSLRSTFSATPADLLTTNLVPLPV